MILVFAFDQAFSYSDGRMDTDGSSGNTEDFLADVICVSNNSGTGNLNHRQSVVEGSHGIPEIRLSTTETAVTYTDRPDVDIIETHCRAVGEGFRAFAADLVQAVAELMGFVTELLDKTAFIEMRASLAMVVDPASIGKERTIEAIKGGQPIERQVMEDGTEERDRIWRTA